MATLKRSRFRILLFGAMAIGLTGQSATAAAPSAAELAVKATFLVKFASYVDWPAEKLRPGAPIAICIVGRDPFGAVLDRAAAGQESNGHAVVVRRVASASQAEACHFAYLGGSGRDVSSALSAIGAQSTVTVSDARASNTRGMIHFQIVGGRVKFDIDAVAASRAGIHISSKLLGLARTVRREGGR